MLVKNPNFRSHLFSLSETKLELHENLSTCVIFGNQNDVCVSNHQSELKAKIICIRPDIVHCVTIPAGGAEILYLDGVKYREDIADFEALKANWADIPNAFYRADHKSIEALRAFLDQDSSPPDRYLLNIIEELYSFPFDRMSQEDLAVRLGLERTQALKYFKNATGQTFRRFKKWAAMVTVASKAYDGQAISLAGIDAGFSDAAHTSRTAREVFGLTPTNGLSSLINVSTLVKEI